MDSNQQPNTTVKIVFKETWNEEEGVTFLNIYVEKPEGGREIDAELVAKGQPTLAEQWGYEMLGFVEDLLRMKLQNGGLQGHLLTLPNKKDMN
jgi:hypothetical protein